MNKKQTLPQSNMSGDELTQHRLKLKDESVLSVDKIVGDINRRKEEEQTKKMAQKYSLLYLNLMNYQPEANVVDIIPKELAQTGKVFAFKKEGQNIYLALSNLTDTKTVKALEYLQGLDEYKFIPVLVSVSSMKYLLSIYDIFAPPESLKGDIEISQIQQQQAAQAITTWKDLANKIKGIPTSQLFETIVSSATYLKASDIHIEPTQRTIHIRFRIDGMLQDITNIPKSSLKSLISRIKFLSKLKLNITRASQDGRFSIKIGTTHYDIRVSILPTAWGESVVLRLLPQEGNIIALDKLGLIEHNAKTIATAIKQPNGLILNTGPTGSGKTTTLYSILNTLNTPGKKIITIEDPIEYRLAGITQSQIDSDKNYTFANGLRSIMRQDPDVVLVGEIRDKETADITIDASLTGHLVLSTLHTNNAAGAIPRLVDLELKPKYFIEAILIIIAQRLVRKVCPYCAQEYAPDQETISQIKKELDSLPATVKKPAIPKILKRPDPKKASQCPNCHGTGYAGRIGIFEILEPNEEIIKAVLAGTTIGEIQKLAVKNGMITLKQDGILKVLNGITTIDEINRVTKKE